MTSSWGIKIEDIFVVLFVKRLGISVMDEHTNVYVFKWTARNEKKKIPELLHVFVANARIGFSRVWSPHPPFY